MAAHGEVLRVLRNDILRKYFTRHMVTSLSEENIEFWRDVQKYKAGSDKCRQEMCPVMLNKYICKRAPLEVNIDGPVKEAILSSTSAGATSPDLFDDAENQVLLIMEHNQMPLFKQSDLYTIAIKKYESSNKKSKKFLSSKKHKKQVSTSSGGSTPADSFEPLNFIEQQQIPEPEKTPEVKVPPKIVRRSSSCSSIQKRVVAIRSSPSKRFAAKDKSTTRTLGASRQATLRIRKNGSSRKLGVSKEGAKLRRSKSKIIFGSVPKLLGSHKKSNSDEDVVIAQPVHSEKRRRKKSNDSSGSKKRLLPGEVTKVVDLLQVEEKTSGVSFASSAPMTSLLDVLEKKPMSEPIRNDKIDIELDMSYMNPDPSLEPDAGSGAAIIGMFEMELTETISEQFDLTSSSEPKSEVDLVFKRAYSEEDSHSAWRTASKGSTRPDLSSTPEPTKIKMALARKESFEETRGQTDTRPRNGSAPINLRRDVEARPRKKKKKKNFLKILGSIMK